MKNAFCFVKTQVYFQALNLRQPCICKKIVLLPPKRQLTSNKNLGLQEIPHAMIYTRVQITNLVNKDYLAAAGFAVVEFARLAGFDVVEFAGLAGFDVVEFAGLAGFAGCENCQLKTAHHPGLQDALMCLCGVSHLSQKIQMLHNLQTSDSPLWLLKPSV
mgnify:CR=1 FL=1